MMKKMKAHKYQANVQAKAAYIASGMFVMGSGSLLFASPHFFTDRWVGADGFRESRG